MQFLVSFNGSNSLASITLKKKRTLFLTPREKYKIPTFDVLQQSKNSRLFFPGKESSINDVHETLST